MNSWHGRLIITAEDHPKILDDALHESIGVWAENQPKEQLERWTKKANDAWDALEGSFAITNGEVGRPDGESAVIFVSPDEMELALVGYGCKLLEAIPDGIPEEIPAINGLLKEIDRIKVG